MRGGVTAKLDGLKIMAPNGIHFSSLESAIKENSLSFAFHRYAPQKFYNFVGITLTAQDIRALKRAANTSPPKKRQRLVAKLPGPSIIEVDCSTSEDENTNGSTGGRLAQHPLCGKSFYKEWLRLDGKKMFKTGKITNVANGNGKKGEDFTVEFSADCRNLVKEPSNRTLCSDSFMKIGCDDAWDGCFRSFDVMGTKPTQLLAKAPNLFERWETPNTYLRKMVPAEGTVIRGYHLLPCLQITYKGFLLKFSVKESDIDTTRFGVFLSAKPLFESNDLVDRFSLPAGHLLDFGVLAPFRTEDIRSDHEHLIKSIVHSCNNEKYCFLSRDKTFILDITDDMTSNLHSIARIHIPPFVNQISGHDGEPASVHARFDPEGALHYLLGHPTREQGDFVLIANGEEKEIFAHPQNYHDLAVSGSNDLIA